MPGFGLVPWGLGSWGLPIQPPSPIPPPPSNINVINVNPAPGSFNISRSQVFTFTIKTSHFALNTNSIYIFLDNKIVINGSFTSPDFIVVSTVNSDGISLDYTITPTYLFTDGSIFTLQVYATDIYGNPSFPFWAGYVVADTRPRLITPIYPLDRSINVPLDLTIHFLINQLAAPGNGIDRSTINVYINDSPAIINSEIQASFGGIFSAINFPIVGNITSSFEILLDCLNRYIANEIVTIKVDVKSTIVPVVDTAALFLNKFGHEARNNSGISLPSFEITDVLKLSNSQTKLTLDFDGYSSFITDGYIGDGYQIKNSNGNIFHILDIIDGYNIIVQTLPKTLRDQYSFITSQYSSSPPTPVFAGYFQGVYLVDNLGDGYHINVTWHPARTTRPDFDLAFLIYYSTSRADVFTEEPKLITQGRRLPLPETIKGADAQLFGFFAQMPLPVGVTHYFGVRATEYPHSSTPFIPTDGYGLNAAGRTVVDGYSFRVPTPIVLTSSIIGSGAITITLPSTTTTTGFVNADGYITVGQEIMRYSSTTPNSFIVPANGRGLFGSEIQSTHEAGELIKLYYGNYDDNTVIAKNLVSWEAPNDPKRVRSDLVTTDFTLADGYNVDFPPFDYCGYHRFRPDELFKDLQCNTYVGGEFNGLRGLFLSDRVLANEEQLLEIDGEPAVLLRRIWGGETCLCRTSRRDSARVRSCPLCFGTGFKGGFVQYSNPRRSDRKIMVHFAPDPEELGFSPQNRIEQRYKPSTWTLSVPAIKDRDILVRFNQYGQREFMYVVNNVSRGRVVFGQPARQKLSISRIDRADVLYQFKLVL